MNKENLLLKAKEARKLSYSPYSNFAVGAAVETKDGQAEIIDITGKTVKTIQLNNAVNRIVISDLPQGMYVLHASGETRKFVKQ